ncbi:hypothetical protein D9M69_478600 [compost metagenome]
MVGCYLYSSFHRLMAANTVVSSRADASRRWAAATIVACRVLKKGLIRCSSAIDVGRVGMPCLRKLTHLS